MVFAATASEADFKLPHNADALPRDLQHPSEGMPGRDDAANDRKWQAQIKRWEAQQLSRWQAQRALIEDRLRRCLHPAARPADADRRPVAEVPSTLSYTMLAAYMECSRKVYLRFLVGFFGSPRSRAADAGSAFHAAVEAAAGARRSGHDLSFGELREAYIESAVEARGEQTYMPSPADEAMLRAFWESPERLAEPLYVEEEFYWPVGPGYLHGFIDRIQRHADGTIELIDFKTSKSALSVEAATEHIRIPKSVR